MFLKINTEQLLQALDISWKSLVALFVAMLLIYVSINFLSSIKKKISLLINFISFAYEVFLW